MKLYDELDLQKNKLVNIGEAVLDTDAPIKVGTNVVNDTGWEDIIGNVSIHAPGSGDPAFNIFTGGIRSFQFSNSQMNEIFLYFHIPHGYEPGTDLYIHTHWATDAAESGNAKWSYEITYAKGHNQGAFSTPIQVTTIQTGSLTPRQHLIAETIFTDDGTSLIDKNLIEVDGVVIVRMYRDPADVDDTLTNLPFVHFVDIHYKKGRFSTKEKSFPFY